VTLALAWDARTIYFAFADPAGKDPYATPGYALASAEFGEAVENSRGIGFQPVKIQLEFCKTRFGLTKTGQNR
jgi:hypothetical protein